MNHGNFPFFLRIAMVFHVPTLQWIRIMKIFNFFFKFLLSTLQPSNEYESWKFSIFSSNHFSKIVHLTTLQRIWIIAIFNSNFELQRFFKNFQFLPIIPIKWKSNGTKKTISKNFPTSFHRYDSSTNYMELNWRGSVEKFPFVYR